MGYATVFGGSTLYPSNLTYLPLALTADTQLYWPIEAAASQNVVADLIDVTPSASGFYILLPDATKGGLGVNTFINNLSGTRTFGVKDASGAVILTVAVGTAWILYLADNSTSAGTWRSYQFGAQAGSINIAAIAGSGLLAIGTSLNQSMPIISISTNYTSTTADRASVLLWTGAAGTVTLPAPATAGSNWFVNICNAGTGDISVAPAAGTIDGAASKTFTAGISTAIVFTNGTNYYTLGYGSNGAIGGFDYTAINVGGTGDYTITGAQLNRISYLLTGVLTGARNFVVPATVQQYWINNQTTGAFTLTVKPAAGTGKIVAQGSQAILYCDGTNVQTAQSGTTLPLAVASGGTGATTAATARTNLGSTAVGDALFTTASAAAARTTLGSSTLGDALFVVASEAAAHTLLTTTNPWEISTGGTGARTAQAAIQNLSAYFSTTAAETSAAVVPTDFSYPPGDVRRYNVKGDNATDDTTAINNSLKVGYYGVPIVFQPWMTCIITNLVLSVANTNVPPSVCGNGATLKAKAAASGILVKIENPHSAWPSFQFDYFTLNGNNLSTTGLEVHGSQRCNYTRLDIRGIAIGTGTAGDGVGLYLHSEASYGIYYNTFWRIQCGQDSSGGASASGACARYGFYEYGPGPQYRCSGNTFNICYARENGSAGWYIDYGQNTHVDCAAELNLSYGLVIDNTSGMSWYGGYFEANKGTATLTFTAVFVGGETSGTLTGNWNANTSASQYSVTFSNGDVRTVTLTNGATTATWAGGLSAGATATATITTIDLHVTGNAGGVLWQLDRISAVLDGADNANWAAGGMMFMGRGSNGLYHDYNGRLSARELRLRSGGIAVNNATPPSNGLAGVNSQDLVFQVSGSTKFRWAQATGVMQTDVGFAHKRAVLAYSASMTPNVATADIQEVTANNGVAFTINAPTNPTDGQFFTLVIKNTSGGALGAITFNATFHNASAYTPPSNGNNRAITWYYNGTNWIEINRAPADVAN